MAIRQYDLGDAELGVMRVLWDEGTCTVRDVLDQLHASGRNVAYTTVQTLLTRLEQKQFVTSNKTDLAFVYRAKLTRARLTQSKLKSLVSQLYDGAAGPLVLQLVRNESLKPAEIDELHRLIDELDERTKRTSTED